MAEHVLMTALSPTMEEGTIVAWKKNEGESVAAGDVLCEIETDKATMDYEATQEGTLLKIVRGEGSSAKVGDPIAVIGESGEDVADLVAQAEAAGAGGAAEGDASAGDKPSDEQPAAQAADTVPAPAAENAPAAAPPTGVQAATTPAPAAGGSTKASPLARKLASERGIDIRQVAGSGPDGRVVKRDIENYTPAAGVAAAPAAGAAGAPGAAPGTYTPTAAAMPLEDREFPVTGKRAVIAKRLAESKFSAPHYYLKVSVTMDTVMSGRKTLNQALPNKVSFNAYMIKLVAEAIKRHPMINASWQGTTIRQFGSIDIGLAVDLGNGLITPIVRNCGNRGIVDIDGDLKMLIEKAKNNQLQPTDYQGATFTISNLGSFGIEEFTAVINPPGSAILALGEVKKTPVVDDAGNIVAADVMKMTLSCDHRVIDGAAGAMFLNDLKLIMEHPVRVLF